MTTLSLEQQVRDYWELSCCFHSPSSSLNRDNMYMAIEEATIQLNDLETYPPTSGRNKLRIRLLSLLSKMEDSHNSDGELHEHLA